MKERVWTPASEWNLLPTGVVVLVVAGAAPLIGWAVAWQEWQILALLGLFWVLPVILRLPVISTFGAYALLVPFDFVATAPGAGGSLTRLVGMMAAVVLLVAAVMERRLVRPPTAAVLWAVFVLWAALSAGWAVDSSTVFRGLRMLLSLFLLYIVAVSVRVSEKELTWVCALTVLGGVLAAGWSVLYGTEDPSARSTLSIGGQGASLNAFALSLILPLALAIGGFIGARSMLVRAAATVAVGVIAGGIYLTMSRGALAGLAVMALVFLYRFRVRWQILLVGCLLMGVAATMPTAFFDRILAVGEKDATGAGRTAIWSIGLEAGLQRHGLIGSGLSTFTEVFTQTVVVGPNQGGRGAHNTYLSAWVELGIVGLALLVAGLACHLYAVRRVRGTSNPASVAAWATEAGCYGVLVSVFFGDYLWTKYFWLPWILLAWGVQKRERQASSPAIARPEQVLREGRTEARVTMRPG